MSPHLEEATRFQIYHGNTGDSVIIGSSFAEMSHLAAATAAVLRPYLADLIIQLEEVDQFDRRSVVIRHLAVQGCPNNVRTLADFLLAITCSWEVTPKGVRLTDQDLLDILQVLELTEKFFQLWRIGGKVDYAEPIRTIILQRGILTAYRTG